MKNRYPLRKKLKKFSNQKNQRMRLRLGCTNRRHLTRHLKLEVCSKIILLYLHSFWLGIKLNNYIFTNSRNKRALSGRR